MPRHQLGISWALWCTAAMPRKRPTVENVATALAKVLRRGLPVGESAAGSVLLSLRGVVARAADADNDDSRATALDGVLRALLARFPDERYAPAVRALFGLPPGAVGQTLTARRDIAARSAGHEVHHFRKRVEPRLLEYLAELLLVDDDRFTRSYLIAPRLAPNVERQTVVRDPFAWEVAVREEVLCRLWSSIYTLRAELLAVERLISLDASTQAVARQAVTAAWQWARTAHIATSFADEHDGDVAELLDLAGWTPPLTEDQAQRLIDAATNGGNREEFVATLHDDADLGNTWVSGFLASPDRTAHSTEGQIA
jgi:hypothetical protein